jgi:hypothetical protein
VKSCLDRAREAEALARAAFADGNRVIGVAAVVLALQYVRLARLLGEGVGAGGERRSLCRPGRAQHAEP